MNRPGSLFPLLIVALLAAASFWLEYIVRLEVRSGLGNNRHDPDSIVENFTLNTFDAEGRLQSQLTASRLTHYPDDDSSEVEAPIIRFLGEGRLATFTSRKGLVSSGGEQLTLRENVRGERPPQGGAPRQILMTEELQVFKREEIARTALPFVLTHGNMQLQGVGAQWNNLTGRFDVLQQLQAQLPGRQSNP